MTKALSFAIQENGRSSSFGSVRAFVRGPARLQQGLLVAAACVVFAGVTAAAGGADGSSPLQRRAARLRGGSATLAQQSHQSLLELYSLDAKLADAQTRLAALHGETARVRAERASVRRQLRAARQTIRVSQVQLAQRVRALYEQGDTDALAVVLGASSIDDAITGLDDLNRSAELNRKITGQAQRARTSLERLFRRLAARDARLRALTAQAQTTLAGLSSQRAARGAYIATLRRQQQWTATQLARIDTRAAAAAVRTRTIAAPVAAAAPATASSGSTIVVVATGYSLSGTTATGIPVGWGVAAVDPSLIPLGTHMNVPGYGSAVAADTGGGVNGAMIDLWFPTDAQARAWGRRTVSITLQ